MLSYRPGLIQPLWLTREETEITIKVMGISKITMDQKIWLKFDPDMLEFVR